MNFPPFKFIFFGTPEPAVDILNYLKEAGLVPQLIVTNPDKLVGRNKILTPSPVKLWAIKNKISIFQPIGLDENSLSKIKELDCELFLVVAYGGLIPKTILDLPKYGVLNVHYSLLPKYRGASPIESHIINDDRDVGVSIMLLDEKLDHGPIVESCHVEAEKLKNWPPTAVELRKICNEVAGKLLLRTLPLWVEGKIKAKNQEHDKATYSRKITTEDRKIDLTADDYKNFLKIQAFSAWGTYFFAEKNGKKIRVIIKSAEFKEGKLVLLKVIPEGKKEMSFEDFVRGL